MNHPDFRVGKKIFATLGPDGDWGMVKLTTDEQASLVKSEPDVFQPFNGAWGRGGATKVQLANAQESTVQHALILAWRSTAPTRLVQKYDQEKR